MRSQAVNSPQSVFRRVQGALCAAGVLACLCTVAAAQQDGVRIYEEQLRVKLDEQVPAAREHGFDAGGWFDFAFFTYNDTQNRVQRTLRLYELRGWANYNYEGVHQFYVRGLLHYADWNTGTNPKAYEGDDFQESLERAWYQFDLGQMLRNQTGRRPRASFKVKVGREYATIGTALTLSTPLDMVQIHANAGDWELMALLGKTLSGSRNIDDSTDIANHQDRCFWGLQLRYDGLDMLGHHRPFVYFLENQDHSDPTPNDPTQEFAYDSRYVGLGSEGTLVLPNLRYQAEIVGEWGKTYSDGATSDRDDIEAMAMDFLLEYLFQTRMQPKVSFEYLFGSGDSDRRSSATSTVGGNRPGTVDHAFNAFGFRDTGIAFSPRLANLNIYILGGSFFPLESYKLFEKMELGSKVFFYQKHRSGGPISDTAAVNDSSWVGWEWDLYCNWRITSDVTYTIRYGAFQPGEAFDNDTCRQFLYTGVTFSF